MRERHCRGFVLLFLMAVVAAGCDETQRYSLSAGAEDGSRSPGDAGPDDVGANPGGDANPGDPNTRPVAPTGGPDLIATAPLVVREGSNGAPHIFFLGEDSGLEVAWFTASGWEHRKLGVTPRFGARTVPFGAYEGEGRLAACAAEGVQLHAFVFSGTWQTATSIELDTSPCSDCDQHVITSCSAVLARDGLHVAWAVEHNRDGETQTRSVNHLGPDGTGEEQLLGDSLGFEVDLFLDPDGTPHLLWNRGDLIVRPIGEGAYRATELTAGTAHTFHDGMHIYTESRPTGIQTWGIGLTQTPEGLSEQHPSTVLDGRLHTVAMTRRGPAAVWVDDDGVTARVAGPGRYAFTDLTLSVPPRSRRSLVVTGHRASGGLHLVSLDGDTLRWEATLVQ